MIIPFDTNLKKISNKLRHKPTEAERCLWKRLRLSLPVFIFHRQKPIGGYVVDFYCSNAKLVIEVDGEYHKNNETIANDRVRDEIMHNLGLTVLRFPNSEVLNNTDEVVEKIRRILLDSSFDKERQFIRS